MPEQRSCLLEFSVSDTLKEKNKKEGKKGGKEYAHWHPLACGHLIINRSMR